MVIFFILGFAGFSAVVMLLWNALIPGMLGLNTVGYLQAAGLLILARLLFGGSGLRGGSPFMHFGGHNPLREKWMKMTPEEKKQFIKKRREMWKKWSDEEKEEIIKSRHHMYGHGKNFHERNFGFHQEDSAGKEHE